MNGSNRFCWCDSLAFYFLLHSATKFKTITPNGPKKVQLKILKNIIFSSSSIIVTALISFLPIFIHSVFHWWKCFSFGPNEKKKNTRNSARSKEVSSIKWKLKNKTKQKRLNWMKLNFGKEKCIENEIKTKIFLFGCGSSCFFKCLRIYFSIIYIKLKIILSS